MFPYGMQNDCWKQGMPCKVKKQTNNYLMATNGMHGHNNGNAIKKKLED